MRKAKAWKGLWRHLWMDGHSSLTLYSKVHVVHMKTKFRRNWPRLTKELAGLT